MHQAAQDLLEKLIDQRKTLFEPFQEKQNTRIVTGHRDC